MTARRCDGTDHLAALDRMRRELFDADAARWSKGRPKKNDLVAAFGYWIGYPSFLEMIGHNWRDDSTRTAAYHALNHVHTQATHLLMAEAERQGLDPHPLYECARVVQEIFADAPEKYYAGPYDTWPECLGAARYALPAGQQEALRAGEAVYIRLAVKLSLADTEDMGKIQQAVAPQRRIAEVVGPGGGSPVTGTAGGSQVPEADGIYPPNRVRLQGKDCETLSPTQMKIVQFMLGKESAPKEDVVKKAWDSGCTDEAVRTMLAKMNAHLRAAGITLTFYLRNGHVKK